MIFCHENKYPIVGAGIAVFFHVILLILAIRGNEGGGFLIIGFSDFPLFILANWFSLLEHTYLIFGLGGTLMYAVLGWWIGLLIRKKSKSER